MAVIRRSQRSNFTPSPQARGLGLGSGRRMLMWKRDLPWLVIAAEQLCVAAAGSGDALLEDRRWIETWGISPSWLGLEIERIFPGVNAYLDERWTGKTDWRKNLRNRVYKMYYNGTSARKISHDPLTRPSVSIEHWRNWPARIRWEAKILYVVSRRLVVRCWRGWL